MNSHNINNLAEPVNNSDATTKFYVDSNVGISQIAADARYYLNSVTLDDIDLAIDVVDINNNRVANVSNPIANTDALNLQTADGKYLFNTVTLDQINNPVANISLNGHKITNLANATLATDALNR
jgi:hypothetical protein